MNDTIVIDGSVDLVSIIDGDLELEQALSGECGIITRVSEGYPAYTGPTEITPTRETQTLETAYKSVLTNIVVKPIPENYGLITWNGSVLTVS